MIFIYFPHFRGKHLEFQMVSHTKITQFTSGFRHQIVPIICVIFSILEGIFSTILGASTVIVTTATLYWFTTETECVFCESQLKAILTTDTSNVLILLSSSVLLMSGLLHPEEAADLPRGNELYSTTAIKVDEVLVEMLV